jgi:hypothetical protein
VFPKIFAIANYGNVVLPDLWHINPYLAVFVFTIMTLVLFYLIDRAGLQRKKK